jgi:5-methyltetrahydropteroyltriglutamate--homocysteine methyltransferase
VDWWAVPPRDGNADQFVSVRFVTKGHAQIKADIDHLKSALAQAGIEEGFMTSVGPGSFARGEDLHYKTEEEFVFASAEAMRKEYRAIVEANLVLQIDDPSLPDNWDMINPEPPLEEFKKFEAVRIAQKL